MEATGEKVKGVEMKKGVEMRSRRGKEQEREQARGLRRSRKKKGEKCVTKEQRSRKGNKREG